MEKVKVTVPGCGSFYAKFDDPTVLRQMIMDDLRVRDISCEEIKRGPKKRVVLAEEGAEGNNHD